MWKFNEPRKDRIILKNEVGGFIPHNFRIFNQDYKNQEIDKYINAMVQNSETEPHICGQLIFDKGTKVIEGKKVLILQ